MSPFGLRKIMTYYYAYYQNHISLTNKTGRGGGRCLANYLLFRDFWSGVMPTKDNFVIF